MVGNQHANAATLEEIDDALNFDHGDRVDAGKRFVEQDKARLGRQGARNFHPSALTAGQGQRGRIAQVLHPQILQQCGQTLLNLYLGEWFAMFITLQLQHSAHVVLHIEFAKNRGFLRQIAQAQPRPAMNWHVRHRLTIDGYLASTGVHQAHNHVKRGGLARAIGPEQPHDLALAHGQRDVLDDLATAVKLLKMTDFESTFALNRSSS